MAKINLTDAYIKVVSTSDRRLELFDDKINGLVLRVSKEGRKTWVMRYRAADGRQPRFTLGTYPALKLVDARSEAIKLMAQTQNRRRHLASIFNLVSSQLGEQPTA